MSIRRMVTGSGVERAKSSFAPGWKGWLLLVAVSGAMCLSPVPAAAGIITTIDEISVDSIISTYDYDVNTTTGTLTMEQSGVVLIIERSDNTQQTLSDVYFKLVTTLASDTSAGGIAMGSFTGGTITITDSSGTLLQGPPSTVSTL